MNISAIAPMLPSASLRHAPNSRLQMLAYLLRARRCRALAARTATAEASVRPERGTQQNLCQDLSLMWRNVIFQRSLRGPAHRLLSPCGMAVPCSRSRE